MGYLMWGIPGPGDGPGRSSLGGFQSEGPVWGSSPGVQPRGVQPEGLKLRHEAKT